MGPLICRTCLETNLSPTSCVQIQNLVDTNQMKVKDMLELFMPEMDLDIISGDVVMCLQCSDSLKKAYTFKDVCLKTEEKIYDYLQKFNISLGTQISLSDVVNYKLMGNHFSLIKTDQKDDLVTENCLNSNQNGTIIKTDTKEKQSGNGPNENKRKIRGPYKTKKSRNDYNSLKRSYTCDQCEYKAYRLDLLNTHKQKHNKNMLTPKEYKCDHCAYRTLRKRALDRHLFTHKGKSPHLCNICNKRFAEKYQLTLHTITHTGQDLPHKCIKCDKGYLTKSYLKQHMETRHCIVEKCEEQSVSFRSYKCKFCELSFSDKRGLDAHSFTHTGADLPYKCKQCDFTTAWKGNLTKHRKNKHEGWLGG